MSPFKILVIDDDPEQVEILKTIVSGQGRDIHTCTDSKQAFSMIDKNHFDLIFTDISMPEVDGVQILKYVKENSPSTEVIPITAFGDWGIYAEALKLGAKDFVNKPFNMREIQGIVARIASSSR